MDGLRVLTVRIPDNALIAAECASLTGGLPDVEGIAACDSVDGVASSAYLSSGLRYLAEAATLDELTAKIQSLSFPAERFMLELLRVSPDCLLRKPTLVQAIADVIPAYPDLRHPLHRFLVVAGKHRLIFGEILTECQHTYQLHDRKPFHTSSSLPARLARALVNLVRPTAHSILDPFCGTGSILLEAQALGLQAYAMDINSAMVEMARANLAHFGYIAQVEQANALDCSCPADAIVTDLPYGRVLREINQQLLMDVFHHLVDLAPQAVYVAGEDLATDLFQVGYRRVQVFEVRKRPGMSRFVNWAQVN